MPRSTQEREHVITSAVSVRGQTIIPKPLREVCRIREGDLLQWRSYKGGLWVQRVIVRPAQEDETLSARDWRALDRLVARQRQRGRRTLYTSLEEAKQHSRKLLKHAR